LEVIPLFQLRQEKKFSGMEELQNQIKKDLESARNYLSEHELLPVE
jgi:FAD synthase